MEDQCDIAVVGAGPGGYIAALRAAQLGKKVALIEEHKIGGTCMNYGCIPAKFLLTETKHFCEFKKNSHMLGDKDRISLDWESVQEKRSHVVERLVKGIKFVIEKNGIHIFHGKAVWEGQKDIIIQENGNSHKIEADKIILATGSRSADLPFVKADGERVITNKEALALENIPKSLLIIGAGAIGLEMGTIYQRMGTEVAIVEIMPTILPESDEEMVTRLTRMLKKQGLNICTQMKVEDVRVEKDGVLMKGFSLKTEEPFSFEAEKLLLAAGRKPNSEWIVSGLPGIKTDRQGFVSVNEKLETGKPGVYAIGDLIGGKLLAHKASHEGIVAAENAAGFERKMSYRALPMAVFTEPEFASIGLTEKEAEEQGIKLRVGRFSLQASGRALSMGKVDGIVKILINEDDMIVGGHILAPNASELIPEITLAMEKNLTIDDLSSAVHIHPTLSEAIMEAGLKAKNRAFHVLNE
ncbi:MAG: dihydrolipoyl dehydrogenase [Candidatus Aminicenantes bacterium]|nr:dihydrolipoyl dehydrogenase [Candidatus Aminicenantes bacterium]